jgi:hypothetical protein
MIVRPQDFVVIYSTRRGDVVADCSLGCGRRSAGVRGAHGASGDYRLSAPLAFLVAETSA